MLLVACRKDAPLVPFGSSDTHRSAVDERCGCLPPVLFEVQEVTGTSAVISWNVMPEATIYTIEVTRVDFQSPDNELAENTFFAITDKSQIYLSGLTPNSTYKYRVTTVCRSVVSSPSEWMEFDTKGFPIREPHLPGKENMLQSISL